MAPDVLHYSIVRLVPHPARNEAINLGVVVVNDAGDFADFRFARAYKVKLAAIAPDFDTSVVSLFLRDFAGRFPRTGQTQPLERAAVYRPNKETLEDLANQFAYQVQFTAPRAYVADEPSSALDELFREFVAAVPHAEKEVVDRHKIRSAVKRALTRFGVPRNLVVERPVLAGRHGANTLDIGVCSPEDSHLSLAIEPVSFSIPSRDDVIRERDHLAWVAYDVGSAKNGLTIGAVVSEPLPSNRNIYDQTLSIFRELEIATILLDDLENLRSLLPRS